MIRMSFSRRRAVALSGSVAPAVRRGMGQDAVGAIAAHRIAGPARRATHPLSTGRRAMVCLGAVVLLAAFAGCLLGRVLSA